MSRGFDMGNLLMTGNNLIAAENLYNEIGNAKQTILEKRLIPLLNDYAKSQGLELENCDTSGSRCSGFSFKRKKWNGKYVIGFEFQESEYKNLLYGIQLDDGDNPSVSKSERNNLHKLYPESNSTKWWPCFLGFDEEEYKSWSTEVFIKINKNPKEVAKHITDKVTEILEKIDSM